jgi:undecaprenyl-diphosphatase
MVTAASRTARPLGVETHSPFRLPLLAFALVSLAALAADTLEVLSQPVPGFDLAIERAVQAAPWGPIASLFSAIDWFEGLKQVAAAVLGLIVVAIWNRRGLLLMVWGALSGVAYQLLEMVIQRPRPDAHLVHVIRHTHGFSFPSGHALFFTWFIAYLLLILGLRYLPRPLLIAGWVLQGVILAIVCVGRVYTAEHWPSDVVAGLLLGAAWTLFGLSVRRLSDPVLNG